MTKTLTEQWKDGTLPDGYYYIDYDTQQRIFEIEDGCATYQGLPAETYFLNDVCLIKVLAPVPSYQEYQRLVSKALKPANPVSDTIMCYDTEREKKVVEKLEQQLAIATKALKKYMTFCRHPAEEALKEIEEVK